LGDHAGARVDARLIHSVSCGACRMVQLVSQFDVEARRRSSYRTRPGSVRTYVAPSRFITATDASFGPSVRMGIV
jgi:hypothetical protein